MALHSMWSAINCATFILRIPKSIDFILDTLIQVNMILYALQVSGSRSRSRPFFDSVVFWDIIVSKMHVATIKVTVSVTGFMTFILYVKDKWGSCNLSLVRKCYQKRHFWVATALFPDGIFEKLCLERLQRTPTLSKFSGSTNVYYIND